MRCVATWQMPWLPDSPTAKDSPVDKECNTSIYTGPDQHLYTGPDQHLHRVSLVTCTSTVTQDIPLLHYYTADYGVGTYTNNIA